MDTTTADKRPLLVLQCAPYAGSIARAALDVAMSYAVFARRPRVLFRGDGVLCLPEAQQAEMLGRKSLRKVIDSFPMYDLEDVFVDAQALRENAVHPGDCPAFVQAVERDEMQTLLDTADCILSF